MGVDLGEDLVDKGIVIVPADEVESLARRGDGTVVNVLREVAGGAVHFVFFHFLKACKLYIQYILYVLFM